MNKTHALDEAGYNNIEEEWQDFLSIPVQCQ